MGVLIARNCFAYLWKDYDGVYRVTIEDLFKARFSASSDDEAIEKFFYKES